MNLSNNDVLSEWSGNIVAVMHRCWINYSELASEAGLSRQRLYNILKTEPIRDYTRQKIDEALRSCLRKKGLNPDDFYPTKT